MQHTHVRCMGTPALKVLTPPNPKPHLSDASRNHRSEGFRKPHLDLKNHLALVESSAYIPKDFGMQLALPRLTVGNVMHPEPRLITSMNGGLNKTRRGWKARKSSGIGPTVHGHKRISKIYKGRRILGGILYSNNFIDRDLKLDNLNPHNIKSKPNFQTSQKP